MAQNISVILKHQVCGNLLQELQESNTEGKEGGDWLEDYHYRQRAEGQPITSGDTVVNI